MNALFGQHKNGSSSDKNNKRVMILGIGFTSDDNILLQWESDCLLIERPWL